MIKDIKNTKVITIVCFIVFFFNLLKADCSDLDSASCVLYSEYCDWNEELNQCQDIDGNDGGDHSYIEPSCIPFNQTDPIPMNTTAYADMCMEYLGIPPTVDCVYIYLSMSMVKKSLKISLMALAMIQILRVNVR